MDLTADRWASITPGEREAHARRLARQLPSGFAFQHIQRCELGERQHHVALYRKDDATFALIPCTVVRLGFDADRLWEPNADELESWEDTAEGSEIDKTIQEYIAEVTLRVRQ